jgi:sialic acid synthase SpsE
MNIERLQRNAGIPRQSRLLETGLPGQDHEVGMAQAQLQEIAKAAVELSQLIGTNEINIPGWIQDHITQSYNFITQARVGYHEL